jgi:hypothetical protein
LKPESWAVHDAAELEESQPGDEFHDAEQGSDNLEQLETLSEQKNFEELDGVGSDAEPAPEDGSKSGTTVLPSVEPQLASIVEEPQEALTKELSVAEASAKLGEPATQEKPEDMPVKEPLPEPVKGDDGGKSPAELSFLEPSIAYETSAKRGEPAAQENGDVGKWVVPGSTIYLCALVSSKGQPTSAYK